MDWVVEPREMLGLPAFGFADPGPVRDELTAAMLEGVKTATTALLVDFQIDAEPLPAAGEQSVVFDSDCRPVAIVTTTDVRIATIGTVDDDFARAEGEGYADAAEWRLGHGRYWNSHLEEYRRDLADPGFELSASTPVVCERFRLVARLDPLTGARLS